MFAEACAKLTLKYGVNVSIRRRELMDDYISLFMRVEKDGYALDGYFLPEDLERAGYDIMLANELEKMVKTLVGHKGD